MAIAVLSVRLRISHLSLCTPISNHSEFEQDENSLTPVATESYLCVQM